MERKLLEVGTDDSLIVRVDPCDIIQYDHLMRPSERRPVREVISNIARQAVESSRNHDEILPGEDTVHLFLGGGVVNNPLFVKQGRVHSDIDILAIFPHRNVLVDVARTLINHEGKPWLKYGIGAAEVNISVSSIENKKAYFNLPLEERFTLEVTKPSNSKASPIDLCLAEQTVYEECRVHRFK